jgi:RNA polymerase subunit RPABC4/transcription elongation factor Spt4
MISSCDHCGRILPLWRIRCPNCKKSAMNWLQLLAIAVLVLPTLFLLAKFL